MLWQLPPKERVAYTAIVALVLFGVGFVGAQRLRRPAPIAFEYGTPRAQELLSVEVSGAVKHPGLVQLKVGQRVGDALGAAGGATPSARLEGLDLSQPVRAGMKVEVPSVMTAASNQRPQAQRVGKPLPERASISINQATEQEFERLPGIGPALATRIIEYRKRSGPFRSVQDLRRVKGIGEKKLAAMRRFIKL